MTNKEKIKKIQAVIDHPGRERTYYVFIKTLLMYQIAVFDSCEYCDSFVKTRYFTLFSR